MSAVRLLVFALAAGCASGGAEIDAMIDAKPPIDVAIDSSVTCTSTDTCIDASPLGSVSGDTGNAKLMSTGFQAAWLKVRVTEDDSAIGGKALKLRLRLTSPSYTGFDVIGYINTAADTYECTKTLGTLTTTGNVDVLDMTWGEVGGANGANDGRDVAIEIRPTSAACAVSQLWMLEVEGNPT